MAKDYVEAANWFRKAAEQNNIDGQINLGLCYVTGRGVEKDEVEAAKWYRKAAERNNAWAQNALAWILATSPNPAIRDGTNALVLAEKAVATTTRKKAEYLDTLAAAYAETSQFEKAISTQQEAIELLETEEKKNDYQARLKLYETKVPYRAKD